MGGKSLIMPILNLFNSLYKGESLHPCVIATPATKALYSIERLMSLVVLVGRAGFEPANLNRGGFTARSV